MNYIFISPNFPENYMHFCEKLKANGAVVLGIGSEKYDNLKPELKASLNEYYKVNNMESYDEMLRAVGFFTHKYGKIQRIESHNEYWLEQDARLREDFNIPGYRPDTLITAKKKSEMKKIFIKAGVPVAKGEIIHSREDGLNFIKKNGFPVCIKPDIGVGATDTYRIENDIELEKFFNEKNLEKFNYIMEEWIDGEIVSFDGITDMDGNIIFHGSFHLDIGVMEIIRDDLDVFYYTLRTPPIPLVEYGKKIIKEFNIKERFFHLEFFKKKDGSYVALELNSRPPGGMTIDMYNYATSLDLYDLYAKTVLGKKVFLVPEYDNYAAFVGRKNNKNYLYSIDEVCHLFKDIIVYHGPLPSLYSESMGDYAFILRDPEFAKIKAAATGILERTMYDV